MVRKCHDDRENPCNVLEIGPARSRLASIAGGGRTVLVIAVPVGLWTLQTDDDGATGPRKGSPLLLPVDAFSRCSRGDAKRQHGLN